MFSCNPAFCLVYRIELHVFLVRPLSFSSSLDDDCFQVIIHWYTTSLKIAEFLDNIWRIDFYINRVLWGLSHPSHLCIGIVSILLYTEKHQFLSDLLLWLSTFLHHDGKVETQKIFSNLGLVCMLTVRHFCRRQTALINYLLLVRFCPVFYTDNGTQSSVVLGWIFVSRTHVIRSMFFSQ